jgi:hypothetical protein
MYHASCISSQSRQWIGRWAGNAVEDGREKREYTHGRSRRFGGTCRPWIVVDALPYHYDVALWAGWSTRCKKIEGQGKSDMDAAHGTNGKEQRQKKNREMLTLEWRMSRPYMFTLTISHGKTSPKQSTGF